MLENMDPKIWGSSFWNTIHYIAINYPNNPSNDEKTNIKSFFLLLQYILPCNKCREHYKQNLINFPLTDIVLSCKNNLFEWTNILHNAVNKMNNKKHFKLEDAIKKYNNLEKKSNKNNLIILGIIVIIVLILYFKK